MLVPPLLQPGARVRVIAPSGPFDHCLVWRGLSVLSQRYRVEFSRRMFRPDGFLAGADERRRAELQLALDDPGVRAIIAARGGYGLSRIAGQVDFGALLRWPKWLVGFSDITVLHLEASRLGVASLHAHNVAGLGRFDSARHAEWFGALESPTSGAHRLEPLRKGRARGTLVGGNLSMLATHSAARRLLLPQGCILALEDVGEAPYRVDRMLTALLDSGQLGGVAGVVLGEFCDCKPGRYGVTVEQVLLERLSRLEVPIAAGLPIGHGELNRPLWLGVSAELSVGDTATLTL